MEATIEVYIQSIAFGRPKIENSGMDLEKSLWKAIARKDEDKIRQIYSEIFEKYRRLVYVVCFDILRNKEDAEDASYEAFLSLYEKLGPDFKAKSIKYYLLSASRYICYKKKKETERFSGEFNDESVGLSEDFVSNLDKLESLRMMKEVLSDEEISLILEHILEEKTFKEMADRRGVSEYSVSGKYKRALDKVKERRKRK